MISIIQVCRYDFVPFRVNLARFSVKPSNLRMEGGKALGYWDNLENVNKFLDLIRNKLNLETVQDWNSLKQNQIHLFGGGSLLKKYSMYDIKCLGYPNGKNIFKKSKVSPGYWKDKENINKFILKIKENLNLKTPKDWNLLTKEQITKNGGGSILNHISLNNLKSMGCPEGNVNDFKSYKPRKYWENEENVKNFLYFLKEKYNLHSIDDWNSISIKHFENNNASSLLKKYSLYELKSLGFPDGKYLFDPKIISKSIGYWNKFENVQNFLLFLKEKYSLHSPNDWNSILSQKLIKLHGGSSLLNLFSVYELKCLGCPEGKLLFNKPNKSPGFWKNEKNIQNFLSNLENQLNIINYEDWNRISYQQIGFHGGWGLLANFSKDKLRKLRNLSSDHSNNSKINGRSSQRWLFLQIQKLFPNEEIVEDYFHSEMSRKTGFPVQFDIFLVKRNIAFEYHGKQHYEDLSAAFAPLEMYKHRDREKEILCKSFDIKLIVIPYWWDNNLHSLTDTINTVVPCKL